MNDDKKLSEIEEQLKEGFRDAFDEYLKKKGETIPEPDFSFLNEPKEKKDHRFLYRFGTVAVCVILIFVTSSGMAVWMNSEAAHAMKFNLEKTFHRITDGFFSTDENESAETSENEISITIDSMDDIDDAIAFMPDLPVPEYIPEGFELEELKVSKFMNGSYIVGYTFQDNQGLQYMISSSVDADSQNSAGIVGNAEIIEMDGRTLYFIQDNYTSKYSINLLIENQFISITGDLNKELMLEIAKKINICK